jgi:hypothetical protein
MPWLLVRVEQRDTVCSSPQLWSNALVSRHKYYPAQQLINFWAPFLNAINQCSNQWISLPCIQGDGQTPFMLEGLHFHIIGVR